MRPALRRLFCSQKASLLERLRGELAHTQQAHKLDQESQVIS